MPKFLVLWKLEPTMVPIDMGSASALSAEEMVKGWLCGLEAVKEDVQAGLMKDWGLFAGGMGGYFIWEGASEVELFTDLFKKWIPKVNFEVKPVLTLDQSIEAIKKASQK